jgi:hypothetical protein
MSDQLSDGLLLLVRVVASVVIGVPVCNLAT